MPAVRAVLVALVAAGVFAPEAVADAPLVPVPVVVASPAAPPSAEQIARYSELRARAILAFGEEAIDPTALVPGVVSWQLNVAIATYRDLLGDLRPVGPIAEALRRHDVPASESLKGRFTTLYRRALARFGRHVAGYNIRRGLRRCFRLRGSSHRLCHRRQPYRGEVGRRIARLRHLLHRPVPGTWPRPGWSAAVARNMARIRACESGGFYGAVGQGGGPYGHFGAWQFGIPTWAGVGGHGLPSQASPAEQDWRAFLLWRSQGYRPWECAYLLGII